MQTFILTFTGRKINAVGSFYTLGSIEVRAVDKASAILKATARARTKWQAVYEHIHVSGCVEIG